jgi:tetratricopeptide (TPR) repeat protein
VAYHFNVGQTLYEMGRYREALVHFDTVLAIAPAFGRAHAYRGDALYRLQDFDRAIRAYDRATDLGYSEEGPSIRGWAHAIVGLQRLKENADSLSFAERHLRMAKKLDTSRAFQHQVDSLLSTLSGRKRPARSDP